MQRRCRITIICESKQLKKKIEKVHKEMKFTTFIMTVGKKCLKFQVRSELQNECFSVYV